MTDRARFIDRKPTAKAVAASCAPSAVLTLNTLILVAFVVSLLGAGWMHAT